MQSAFIALQPNGLYCRFSPIVECLTHINMTREDYLNNFTGTVDSREEAESILAFEVRPFSEVSRLTTTQNMTKAEFKRVFTHVILPQNSIFVFKLAL